MFEADDLIFDHRTLEGLGSLYYSLVTSSSLNLIQAMVHSEPPKPEKNRGRSRLVSPAQRNPSSRVPDL